VDVGGFEHVVAIVGEGDPAAAAERRGRYHASQRVVAVVVVEGAGGLDAALCPLLLFEHDRLGHAPKSVVEACVLARGNARVRSGNGRAGTPRLVAQDLAALLIVTDELLAVRRAVLAALGQSVGPGLVKIENRIDWHASARILPNAVMGVIVSILP
jgi:hypothetical protein